MNMNENENTEENQLVIIDRINPCYSTIDLDEWKARIFDGYSLNEYMDGYDTEEEIELNELVISIWLAASFERSFTASVVLADLMGAQQSKENFASSRPIQNKIQELRPKTSLEKLEALQTYIDENPGRYSYGSSGIAKHSAKILEFLENLTGDRYEYHTSGYSENEENDLDGAFCYDVFAPAESGDWIWSPDVIVIIDGTEWYKLDFLGDSGFFDRTIGYHAETLSGDYADVQEIEAGYSSYPYGQISDLYVGSKHDPILKWSDKFQGFLARHESLGETHILRPYLHVGS